MVGRAENQFYSILARSKEKAFFWECGSPKTTTLDPSRIAHAINRMDCRYSKRALGVPQATWTHTHTSEEGAVKNARTIKKFLRCAEHSEKNSSESWGTGLTVERCPREFCSEHELSLLHLFAYEARHHVCELNRCTCRSLDKLSFGTTMHTSYSNLAACIIMKRSWWCHKEYVYEYTLVVHTISSR